MIKFDKKTDPRTAYRNALELGLIAPDQKQFEVVGKLQDLHERLLASPQAAAESSAGGGFFSSLFGKPSAPKETPRLPGLYLWGGVGRGKTLLCDLFFDGLPFDEKRRIHFHRFMREVHEGLAQISNETSPLEILSEQLARDMRVLVLDEMHVNDIADAMLMSGLLNGLYSRGVTIVTTSNFQPDDLYRDGLQRARFLPAIELLKENSEVVFLGGDLDYRLRALQNADIYYTPDDERAENGMKAYFQEVVSANDSIEKKTITINDRDLATVMWSDSVVWVTFDEMCNTARSTDDYIEIAEQFHTVLISGIPAMDNSTSDMTRRFINMIDEFYDRSVKIVVSAARSPADLYTGDRLAFEFDRTRSRLTEMQSSDYLAQQHRP
jgi:cell division protein ZapE